MHKTSLRYLYFAIFISGMSTLAIEFTAQRQLSNIFGNSNLVWASIIGLILIYLTIGYFIGGWWADRSPHPVTLYTIMACGAFLSGLVPLIANPVLRFAANAFDTLQIGVLAGSFAAVLILLSLPVILLGTISPFAIRLGIRNPEEAGRVSGRVYAISTLGSFIGTFLPVLVFIPMLGVNLTYIVFSLGLVLTALLGLWLSNERRRFLLLLWMPIFLLVEAIYIQGKPIKSSAGQIYETESAYNYIQVLERDGYRLLRLNEGQGVHSMWHPTELDFAGPWEQFLAAPFFNSGTSGPESIQRVAIIGLAAGTLARQATEVFGSIPIDGYEIDPEIIRVGQDYFGMTEPNLNAIAQDGRVGLRASSQRYDLIAIDAYRPPYIPPHLTTREFFQLVRQRLTDTGTVAINVGRAPDDRQLIDGLVATLQTVFPSVYVMDLPNTFNSMVYATVQPTDIQDLYQNYLDVIARTDIHPLLQTALERTIVNQQPIPQGGTVFTDDRAPIEWITNNMVLNYIIFGDMESLR